MTTVSFMANFRQVINMAQVKKEDVRSAILQAAFELISEKGYVGASMGQIARMAGVSHANIYIYFDSKLEVFFSLYEGWLKDKIAALEQRVLRAATPGRKCQVLLNGLFRELPTLDNGFANNLVQAIATVGPNESYTPELLMWLEKWVEGMLTLAIPRLQKAHARRRRLAHFVVMAFDGCSVNFRVNRASLPDEKLIKELTDMLLA